MTSLIIKLFNCLLMLNIHLKIIINNAFLGLQVVKYLSGWSSIKKVMLIIKKFLTF